MFFWLVLAVVLVQRAFEVALTAYHTRWIREQGGVEYGRGHYPWMVLLHAAFLCSLALEHLSRPPTHYFISLFPLLAAQALRYSAMWSLGKFWNTRVWVLPGAPPIRLGIFRWIRHPNYAGIVLEFFFLPALFGLWITAVVFTLLNGVMLWVRIRVESQALEGASR